MNKTSRWIYSTNAYAALGHWKHVLAHLRIIFGQNKDLNLATEVWDFGTGNNWIFEPSLFPNGHADGIALYFVDADFCNSPNSEDESPM